MSTRTRHKRQSQQPRQNKGPTLQHVTLTTGHNRSDSPLSEVRPDIIEFFQEWLTYGGVVRHPCGGKSLLQELPDDHLAVVTPRGNTLICTVIDPMGREIVTFSVNGGDSESQMAWNHLHELQTLPGMEKSAVRAPKGRWCGVILHQFFPAFGSFGWLGDFERSLAWAWLTWSEDNKEEFRQCMDNPASYSDLEDVEFDCCFVR